MVILHFLKEISPQGADIFSSDAQLLLKKLHQKFNKKIDDLLIDREKNQSLVDSGILPGFDPNTKEIRDSVWKVRDVPHDLLDRRLEITGPVD